MRSPGNKGRWVGLVLLATSAGCHPPADDPRAVVVATPWTPEARRAVESALGDDAPITWVDLGPGDRPASALARRGGVDLLLGVDPLALAAPGVVEDLEPIESADHHPWRLVTLPGSEAPGLEVANPAATWAERYAATIRRAADSDAEPIPKAHAAVALSKASRHRDGARRVVAALRTAPPVALDPSAGLMADLVASATVNAEPELRAAVVALGENGHPASAEASLLEPPPWPPASVRKLRLTPGDAPLVAILAWEVAPDPALRDWLIAAWNRPSKPLDGAVLDVVATAEGGRLLREPRFRSWLRAEWTAWCRQRYRRVARVARGWVPS